MTFVIGYTHCYLIGKCQNRQKLHWQGHFYFIIIQVGKVSGKISKWVENYFSDLNGKVSRKSLKWVGFLKLESLPCLVLGLRPFGMGLGLGTLGVVGSSASKNVRINRREPPKLGNAGAQPLVVEAWPTSQCALPDVLFCPIWSF